MIDAAQVHATLALAAATAALGVSAEADYEAWQQVAGVKPA